MNWTRDTTNKQKYVFSYKKHTLIGYFHKTNIQNDVAHNIEPKAHKQTHNPCV